MVSDHLSRVWGSWRGLVCSSMYVNKVEKILKKCKSASKFLSVKITFGCVAPWERRSMHACSHHHITNPGTKTLPVGQRHMILYFYLSHGVCVSLQTVSVDSPTEKSLWRSWCCVCPCLPPRSQCGEPRRSPWLPVLKPWNTHTHNTRTHKMFFVAQNPVMKIHRSATLTELLLVLYHCLLVTVMMAPTEVTQKVTGSLHCWTVALVFRLWQEAIA